MGAPFVISGRLLVENHILLVLDERAGVGKRRTFWSVGHDVSRDLVHQDKKEFKGLRNSFNDPFHNKPPLFRIP